MPTDPQTWTLPEPGPNVTRRYRLAADIPGEMEGVPLLDTDGEVSHLVRLVTADGKTVVLDRSLLVDITIEPEPDEGWYEIGGVLCATVGQIDPEDEGGGQYWRSMDCLVAFPWSAFWAAYGGPGVTIRRLVPEPEPVELPWRYTDREGFVAWVEPSPRPWGAARVCTGRTTLGNDSSDLTPDAARAMAAALLTAADTAEAHDER